GRHFRGTGVTVDKARAMKLFERGCSFGHRSACSPEALRYDEASRLRLARLACDSGLKLYCRPGQYAPQGLRELRLEVLDRSCRLGTEYHCRELQDELLREHADAADLTRARGFLADACEAKQPAACEQLVSAWRRDPGASVGTADRQLAAFCAQGIADACTARKQAAAHLQAEAALVRCQKKNDLAACVTAGEHFRSIGQQGKGTP